MKDIDQLWYYNDKTVMTGNDNHCDDCNNIKNFPINNLREKKCW